MSRVSDVATQSGQLAQAINTITRISWENNSTSIDDLLILQVVRMCKSDRHCRPEVVYCTALLTKPKIGVLASPAPQQSGLVTEAEGGLGVGVCK